MYSENSMWTFSNISEAIQKCLQACHSFLIHSLKWRQVQYTYEEYQGICYSEKRKLCPSQKTLFPPSLNFHFFLCGQLCSSELILFSSSKTDHLRIIARSAEHSKDSDREYDRDMTHTCLCFISSGFLFLFLSLFYTWNKRKWLSLLAAIPTMIVSQSFCYSLYK